MDQHSYNTFDTWLYLHNNLESLLPQLKSCQAIITLFYSCNHPRQKIRKCSSELSTYRVSRGKGTTARQIEIHGKSKFIYMSSPIKLLISVNKTRASKSKHGKSEPGKLEFIDLLLTVDYRLSDTLYIKPTISHVASRTAELASWASITANFSSKALMYFWHASISLLLSVSCEFSSSSFETTSIFSDSFDSKLSFSCSSW